MPDDLNLPTGELMRGKRGVGVGLANCASVAYGHIAGLTARAHGPGGLTAGMLGWTAWT